MQGQLTMQMKIKLPRGRNSHMTGAGMLVVSLRGVNSERQLPHIFNIVCHNFQCDIVQKAYVKIPLN